MAPAFRLSLKQFEDRVVPSAIPLPPTGVVAAGISDTGIKVTWNASTDPSVTSYDVTEKVWIKGGYKTAGHWAYELVASGLPTPTATLTGLTTGTYHTYLVTALNSTGPSLYSVPAVGETWLAPSMPYGASDVVLSNGALWSSAVTAPAGLTTQLSLLISGNPLTYSVVAGTTGASINSHTGVVTYKPPLTTTGTVNITIKAANALGSVQQTIVFTVTSTSSLPMPTLSLLATSSKYDALYQQVSAKAVGTDGVTPVAGSFAYAYNGGTAGLYNAGTYQVLVTFTSADPNYGNATLLTKYTITKAVPKISYVTDQTIALGTTSTILSGYISSGTAVPAGEYVIVTVNGVSSAAPVNATSTFSTTIDTSALPLGSYTVTYSYAGDSNFKAASSVHTVLNVIPDAPPVITLNPVNTTTTAGDGVTFTATASGSPIPTVQWQVSTDGGVTWNDVASNTSAQTSTLVLLTTDTSENGWMFRAVFTNPFGQATTTAATLTVETNTGGG